MAYPGFQRGGCLSSGPIRKAGGGGGGCCRFLAQYEKRGGGGVLSVSGPVRKGGGGGGGGGAIGLAQYKRVSRMCWLARAKILATTPILETEGGARAP